MRKPNAVYNAAIKEFMLRQQGGKENIVDESAHLVTKPFNGAAVSKLLATLPLLQDVGAAERTTISLIKNNNNLPAKRPLLQTVP